MTEKAISKPIYEINFSEDEAILAGKAIDLIHALQSKINDHKDITDVEFVKGEIRYDVALEELSKISTYIYLIAIGFNVEIS